MDPYPATDFCLGHCLSDRHGLGGMYHFCSCMHVCPCQSCSKRTTMAGHGFACMPRCALLVVSSYFSYIIVYMTCSYRVVMIGRANVLFQAYDSCEAWPCVYATVCSVCRNLFAAYILSYYMRCSWQIVHSRLHVPVQTVGTILAIAGYFLGHAHGGRQFTHNVHASFSFWLMLMLAIQVAIGVYLKLHIERNGLGRFRAVVVRTHGVIGKALPVATWVQMLFGGIVALGFCRDDHLGQCVAHFIMGSAFIGYGIILTILLLVGQYWLQRTGRSQEFFDSILIAAWGCVNTFTEHRWGTAWVKNDLQHTSMGIVWWCAGLLGIWLSRKRDGRPKRNLFPAVVIMLTGWGMSAHPQTLMLSTHVHATFGYTLMAAGAVRIIEISFVLRDRNNIDPDDVEETNSFQFLTPFVSRLCLDCTSRGLRYSF